FVRAIHQKNGGPGVARQTGLSAANGEFIQYLDSDDLLLPRKFELQVAGLNANPECGVSYCKTRYRFSDGTLHPYTWKDTGKKHELMFPSFLKSRWWDTPTPLYRASVCKQAGPWSNLRIEEDWEYECRVAGFGTRLHFCDEVLAEVRDHHHGRA